MKRQVFIFLKNYSTNPHDIDRLIISSFMMKNNLQAVNNLLLKTYNITQDDTDYDSLIKFLSLLENEIDNYEIETLIELFEFVISPADRIITGAIYTPKYIREYIIDTIFDEHEGDIFNLKIADISCGCGGFLITAAQKIKSQTDFTYQQIFTQNIFGLDIQEYSTLRTRLLFSVLALSAGEDEIEFNFNLYTNDALSFEWATVIDNFIGFDMIVGNPPYVRLKKLSEETKQLIRRWEVARAGLTDLYIPFFQIGFENLAPNGILGYITMNSFFKSLNGRMLRAYFQRERRRFRIIDFGSEQVFKSKNTYTCICFIKNVESAFLEYNCSSSDNLNNMVYDQLRYDALNAMKGWNLKDNATIERLEAVGRPFGDIYKTRHGIATLKNDIFIFKPIREDEEYYYLQNEQEFPIEKTICRRIVNSNKLSRENILLDIIELVIFPYTNDIKPKLLEEKFFMDNYPRTFEYLQNKKSILAGRDKGKGKYENWYAFGRSQSLEKMANKLFFPKFSDKNPSCIIDFDENLLFYNGLAVVGSEERDMIIIKKIMESDIFWYYIKTTSKPYSSKYFSLNGNYINNFGICDLTTEEKDYLVGEENRNLINNFLAEKYNLHI